MRGIRFRATALVTVVLAIALVVGGVIITSVLQGRLTDNLDVTLTAAAEGRATLIADGADPATLTDTQLQEALIWIGREDGEFVAGGGRVLVDGAPGGTTPGTRTVTADFLEQYDGTVEAETEELRIHVTQADSPTDGLLIVIVGSEIEVIDRPVADVTRVLVLGSPLLLLIVGGLTWVTADRALRPVGNIRADAESISAHKPGSTIDVPNTGDEIEALAVTVNEMLGRLAGGDARQREFVGDASHELKSPLANLRIDIETNTAIDEESKSRHLRQIDRLAAIVDDLLALARHDEHQPVRDDPVDLDDAVFDALAAAAPGHRARIDIDGVTPTRVKGDANQLRRLVRNLIDNATRHAEDEVAIMLRAVDGRAILHVDDDGPGVPREARDHIFERFARVDSARGREDGGTGLGLAIVHRVTERHGGTVSVGESPLGGARFTVELPG